MLDEFEPLLREHYERLYLAAFGVTGNRHDADKVLLSLFSRLRRTGLSPELKRNPVRCLHRAVMNSSLSVIRASRRQALADGVRVHDELHMPLMTAVTRLKPRAFEILLLHYKHDYSNAQIAELIGTSENTAAVTLTRLRARLRRVLLSAGYDHDGASREVLRELIQRYVESPSQLDMMASLDWILERLRSTAPHAQAAQTEQGAAVISWWRSRFERCL